MLKACNTLQIRDGKYCTLFNATLPLGEVVIVQATYGLLVIKRKNERHNLWAYVDIHDQDLGCFVKDAKALLDKEL